VLEHPPIRRTAYFSLKNQIKVYIHKDKSFLSDRQIFTHEKSRHQFHRRFSGCITWQRAAHGAPAAVPAVRVNKIYPQGAFRLNAGGKKHKGRLLPSKRSCFMA